MKHINLVYYELIVKFYLSLFSFLDKVSVIKQPDFTPTEQVLVYCLYLDVNK